MSSRTQTLIIAAFLGIFGFTMMRSDAQMSLGASLVSSICLAIGAIAAWWDNPFAYVDLSELKMVPMRKPHKIVYFSAYLVTVLAMCVLFFCLADSKTIRAISIAVMALGIIVMRYIVNIYISDK